MAKRNRRAPAEPTERQLFEGTLAFHTLQLRYRRHHVPNAPATMQHFVEVLPEGTLIGEAHETTPNDTKVTIRRFISADAARRWRTHEIIRETIKVAMRTKP